MQKLKERVKKQVLRCYEKYGKYSSFHEAMSVLREEFEELWEECKKKDKDFQNIENEIIDNIVVLVKMYCDIVLEENKR